MPTPYALSSDLVSAWPAKSLEIATYLDTSLAEKTDLAMVQNAQTGTSYSYALADASKLLSMSNAASNTVLVTKQATVTWVTGTQLRVINLGAGVTTLVADTGVTINGNVALKQYQGGTLIRTASDVWLFVPTASSSGVDLITPTSVAGTGVTLSGGQVSFSAATAISVNGCFSATYPNYLLLLSGTASASAWTTLRMRLSGTDASGANYNDQYLDVGGTSITGGRRSAQTDGIRIIYGDGAAVDIASQTTIFRPFDAATTSTLTSFVGGSSSVVYRATTGQHALATSYDGLSVIPGSGSLTGTLRIYGLRSA